MLTIRTAQLDILPGNIRANWALIEKEIALAKEEGSVGPECLPARGRAIQ